MLLVRVVVASRIEPGIARALPTTIMTAIVSPTARPMAKTMEAMMPDLAAGSTTRQMVCQCVAPRARAPSRYDLGTERMASSDMLTTLGKIMMPSTSDPARMLSPGPPSTRRMRGTNTSRPMNP